ncbi:hypothetical protein R3P38DRAFT_2816725 [Favolaschia claudopus]|uniref:Uncharacterized protein n=1 Tax=Favolaschia claudopus TaxID=2862362 RepID=A0AAV9Z0C2_9AGAR
MSWQEYQQINHVHLLESTAAGQAAGSGSGQDSNGSGGEENDTSSPDLRRSLSRSPEPPPKKPRLEDQGNPSLHPSLAVPSQTREFLARHLPNRLRVSLRSCETTQLTERTSFDDEIGLNGEYSADESLQRGEHATAW